MIEGGDFQALAERIMEDKRSLEVIFRYRPHEQMEMRALIKIVEREWFSRLWKDGVEQWGTVRFNLTEKSLKKHQDRSPDEETT